MNLSASTVPFELIVTLPERFWMKPPKHCRSAISAMSESSSFDMPMPIGVPRCLSFGAAFRT